MNLCKILIGLLCTGSVGSLVYFLESIFTGYFNKAASSLIESSSNIMSEVDNSGLNKTFSPFDGWDRKNKTHGVSEQDMKGDPGNRNGTIVNNPKNRNGTLVNNEKECVGKGCLTSPKKPYQGKTKKPKQIQKVANHISDENKKGHKDSKYYNYRNRQRFDAKEYSINDLE